MIARYSEPGSKQTEVGGNDRQEVDDAEEAQRVAAFRLHRRQSGGVFDREQHGEYPLENVQQLMVRGRDRFHGIEHHNNDTGQDREDQHEVERPRATMGVGFEDDVEEPASPLRAVLRAIRSWRHLRPVPAMAPRLGLIDGFGDAAGTGHAGAAQPAVSARILCQILLVVLLRMVERGRVPRSRS